jgi:hypothetical protein
MDNSSPPPSNLLSSCLLVCARVCECVHEDVLQPPIAPDLSTFLRTDHLEWAWLYFLGFKVGHIMVYQPLSHFQLAHTFGSR